MELHVIGPRGISPRLEWTGVRTLNLHLLQPEARVRVRLTAVAEPVRFVIHSVGSLQAGNVSLNGVSFATIQNPHRLAARVQTTATIILGSVSTEVADVEDFPSAQLGKLAEGELLYLLRMAEIAPEDLPPGVTHSFLPLSHVGSIHSIELYSGFTTTSPGPNL